MKLVPALLISLALVVPAAARASTVDRAVFALARAQQDFDGARASWSWQRGERHAAGHTAGLVALGLVRAYERAGSRDALFAAEAWGRARVADLEAWSVLHDPDIEALVALSDVTGDRTYLRAAVEAFDRRWGGASAEEVLGRIAMLRRRQPAVVHYDAALALRAAVAVGETRFAHQLARLLLAQHGVGMRGPDGLVVISRAALLGALVDLDARRYAEPIAQLAARLVRAQADDGTWAGRNTQATAYAVGALSRLGGVFADTAAARGRAWLTKTQLKDGSWATFHDGLGEPFVGEVVHEVTAEVLWALAQG